MPKKQKHLDENYRVIETEVSNKDQNQSGGKKIRMKSLRSHSMSTVTISHLVDVGSGRF